MFHHRRHTRQRAFSLVEVLTAAVVGLLVVGALVSLMIMTGRIQKSTQTQQYALEQSREVLETLNREVRLAQAPLNLIDPDGDRWGWEFRYRRPGESADKRRIWLDPGADGDYNTPQDNALRIDYDTDTSGNSQVLATDVTGMNPDGSSTALGAFSYVPGAVPLTVQLRIGDPRDDPDYVNSGPGIQGVEINIRIGPRNASSSGS